MSYSPLPNSSFSPRNPSDNTGDRPMSYFQREPVELELTELPRTQSDFSHSSRSHLPEKKLETVALNQPRPAPRARRHGKARSVIRKIWLTVFLPAVAFAYLAFCYVTATRLVPVRIWMINEPANHLYGIKAGVTTITIIVVAIALLPLKSLLDDIKSEEFFRTLHKSPSGVPLKDINSVSIPSNPLGRSILTVLQNRTSKYYAGAILSGILAALISSLAPAALSVGLVSADSDIMALEVGAIGKDSVYIFGSGILGNTINDVFQNMAGEAASMGWVRNVLGAEIAFIPTSSKYGVPVPLSLDPTVRARYLTDVVVMDPICKWTAPSSPIDSNDTISSNIVLDLPDFGFQIQKLNSSFRFAMQNLKSLDVAGDDTSLDLVNLLNSTSMDPITDGSMAWIISRCTSCKPPVFSSDQSVFDLSEIPTREYSFNDTAATSYTVEYSALVCNPRVSIETREVVLDGTGKLEVMESAGLTAQGNLHLLQTTMLLGNGLMKYTSDSGPATPFTEVGRAAQVKMFFGPDLGNSTKTPVLKPQSIEKITEQYGLAQQAALRSYLSGAIATAYVPGRIQVTKLVFTSSLPHIIVSTILFLSVALFINICYLRANMEQFTLFSVATALARSNVGPVCEDAKVTDRAQKGGPSGDVAVVLVEDRRVYLSNHGGPGPSLHME